MDSSYILAYYNPSTEVASAWYPVPGLGSSALYDTRYIVYQADENAKTYNFTVRLMQPGSSSSYTTPVTFTKFRIIVAKVATIIPEGRQAPLDVTDYNAVKEYYNLPD